VLGFRLMVKRGPCGRRYRRERSSPSGLPQPKRTGGLLAV